MRPTGALLALATLVPTLLGACGDDPITAYFAVPGSSTGDDFYALPFPNDLRRHADGRLDLSALPTNAVIADTVRQIAEADLDGFGLNAAIFARFSGALDPASLPDPATSRTETASVYLVDVDPDSPTRGERWPVIASFRTDGTQTMLGNRLVVRPYPGFPLAEATTFALVITSRVAGADGRDVAASGDFAALLGTGGNTAIASAREVYAPLLDWLDEPGGDERDDVVSATVFTTQRATHIMPAIRQAVFATAAPVAADITRTSMNPTFSVFTGTYMAPNIQEGSPPYISSGGRVSIGADGAVVVHRMEAMRFALSVPSGPTPASGWPICIYQHGTGGDWRSFINDNTAARLAAEGIAVISTDQVLHGPRDPSGTDPAIAFFNFNNPVAGRDNPLQGAADAWSQQRLALGMQFSDPESRVIRFDPARVTFFGHSQGGLTGPGYVAFEPALTGAVLSGTGGTFYLSLLDKKEPLDFPSLIATFVRDEPLDEDNPTIHLAQMAVERNDPVNYAPFLVRQLQLAPDGASTLAPRNVFQLEGFTDNYTPNRVIEAFATAMGGDIVQTAAAQPLEGLTLRGRTIVAPPITGNLGSATVVLAQYDQAGNNDGHFVAFDVPAARTQSAKFLGTLAATGQATVVSP